MADQNGFLYPRHPEKRGATSPSRIELTTLKRPPLERKSSSASDVHLLPTPNNTARTAQPTRSIRVHLNRWWKELLACCSALFASIIVFSLLSQFHERPKPRWPFNLSLNAVVSIFTTIMKACMLYPVAECISQLKWLWFTKLKPLADIERFDNASRGINGSLQLLYFLKMKHYAVLGAIIIILAAGIDPLVQQTVQYYEANHPNPAILSGLPVSRNYEGSDPGNNAISDASLMGAAYDGMLNSGGRNTRLNPVCETGNCTFPKSYTSLGFCSTCFNITPWLQGYLINVTLTDPSDNRDYTSLSLNVSLPNGLSLVQGSTIVMETNSPVINVASGVGSYEIGDLGTYLIPYQDVNLTSWQLTGGHDVAPDRFPPGITIQTDSQPLMSIWAISETRDVRCTFDWMSNGPRYPSTDCLSPHLVDPRYGIWDKTVASLPDQNVPLSDDVSGSPLGSWPNVTATLCTLSLCNKVFSGTVAGGDLNEQVLNQTEIYRVVNRTEDQVDAGDPGNFVNIPATCAVNGTLHDLDSFLNLPSGPPTLPSNLEDLQTMVKDQDIFDKCTYSNSFLFNQTVMLQLPQFFNGSAAFDNIQSSYIINAPSARHLDPTYSNQSSLKAAKINWGNSPQLAPMLGDGNVSVTSMHALFTNLADALTNHIRQHDALGSSEPGQTLSSETYVFVAYGWLVLPTTLVMASCVFLAWTAHMVRESMYHDMVWRSSQAALLYHGLDNRDAHGRLVSQEEMDAAQENTLVRLGNEAAGWRLVPAAAGEGQVPEVITSAVPQSPLRRRHPV